MDLVFSLAVVLLWFLGMAGVLFLTSLVSDAGTPGGGDA